MLAEDRLEDEIPDQVLGIWAWLTEELDALGGECSGYQLVERILPQELLIRRLQAAQVRSIAQAAEGITPARRGTASTAGNPSNEITSEQLLAARLAPEFNLHPLTAAVEVGVAVRLVRDLPRIMQLFTRGCLDKARASLIAKRLHAASEELESFVPGCPAWLLIEGMLAAQSPTLTLGELKRLLERLLLEVQPDGGAARHARAFRNREVKVDAAPDGMALVSALVSAEVGQWLDGFLDIAADEERDRAAAAGKPDGRTHAQRRADVLAALIQALVEGQAIPLVATHGYDTDLHSADSGANPASPDHARAEPTAEPGPAAAPSTADIPESLRARIEDSLDDHNATRQETFTRYGFPPVPEGTIPAFWRVPDQPRRKGRGTNLTVTITDTALLGLDTVPGLLDGRRPIPAVLARRLAVAPERVTLIVLPGACAQHEPASTSTSIETECPAGQDHGDPQTSRYRPGRALTDQVQVRFPECTFPGCGKRSSKCDIDHLRPFAQGGVTCVCNMRPACRSHHRLKTFGSWEARVARPGEPYPPGTIIWTTPDGADQASPPPSQPGMPGWSMTGPANSQANSQANSAEPGSPAGEHLSQQDLMHRAERTARRVRRWQSGLAWHNKRQDLLRRRRDAHVAKRRPPLPRPAHAPWGEGNESVDGLGAPPF